MAATISNRALTSYSGDTPSDLFLVPIDYDFTKKQTRTDTPLRKLIGEDPAPKMPTLKLPWGWGSVDASTDQLNGSIDASQTSLTVDDASKFQVGLTFLIESEEFLATGINETTNVVTVATRPYGGSAATHADNMSIIFMTPAIAENQATPLSQITQGEVDYNYFQQTEESVQLSHRAEVIPTGETWNLKLGSRTKAEIRKKMTETIPIQLENRLLYGRRNLGSTSLPSAMGGLLNTTSYITTRNTSLSGPLTENTLMTNLQTVHNLVGDKIGRTIMAHPLVCRIVSSWYNDTRRTNADSSSISTAFTKIDTGWFGTVTLVPNFRMQKSAANGNVPLDQLVVFNPEDLKLVPLSGDSGWYMEPLMADGWYQRIAVRGDFTLKATLPDTRLLLGGFSTTESDYAGLS